MMFNRFYNMEMKNTSASAPSANAGSSCAHTARLSWFRTYQSPRCGIAIMDAIIMASIIICGLIISLRAIALIAILVLVVGLIIQEVNTPWCNELAI